MQIVESLSILQRITNSIISDLDGVEGEKVAKVRGKLDILAGEMNLFREEIVKQEEEEKAKEVKEEVVETPEIVTAPVDEVIESTFVGE